MMRAPGLGHRALMPIMMQAGFQSTQYWCTGSQPLGMVLGPWVCTRNEGYTYRGLYIPRAIHTEGSVRGLVSQYCYIGLVGSELGRLVTVIIIIII